ncbi:transthyretin-like family protein [Bacillus sp. F19]|nr:transthyretin-like family protein [Bacillus sp. F19]
MRMSRLKTVTLSLTLLASLLVPNITSNAELKAEASSSKESEKPLDGVKMVVEPIKNEKKKNTTNQAVIKLSSSANSAKYRVHLQAKGDVELQGLTKYEIEGSAPGEEVQKQFSYIVNGEGAGSIEANVEVLDTQGIVIAVKRSKIDVLATEAGVLQGNSGLFALQLQELETKRTSGNLDKEEYETAKRDLFRQGAKINVEEQQRLTATSDVTVSGKILWTDGSGNTHPAVGVPVEILDEDDISDDLITTVKTDNNGNYKATFENDTGFFEEGYDLFVRIKAEGEDFSVEPDGWFEDVYQMETNPKQDVENGSSHTMDFTLNNTSDNQTAFGIHQSMLMATKYVREVNGEALDDLTVYFPTSDDTSNYDGDINLLQLDRFDWDVIHHEFGHHVTDSLDIEDSPGGSHSSGENLADRIGKDDGVHLAWGEGWPTYFAISLQKEMNGSSLGLSNVGDTHYQDTEDSSLVYDLEAQDSSSLGEDNELSVQRVLWDLYDSNSDHGDNGVVFGDKNIWETLKNAESVTLSEAIQAFYEGRSIAEIINIGSILTEHKIASEPTKPADGHVFTFNQSQIPVFNWDVNGKSKEFPNNSFVIEFYNSTLGKKIFSSKELNTDSYQPTAEEWKQILDGTSDRTIRWAVRAKQTAGHLTGPYISYSRQIMKNHAPDVKNAKPNPSRLWPVDGRMVPIKIEGVVDPDRDPVTIKIKSIKIDEPAKGTDIGGIGTDTARVRATRNGNGDGREYHITFTAADDKGGVSTGKVIVYVPHDQGK